MAGPQSAPAGMAGIFAIAAAGSAGTNIEKAMRVPSGDHASPPGLSVTRVTIAS